MKGVANSRLDKKLPSILVQQGLISAGDMETARLVAEKDGKSLSSILVQTEKVSESDLLGAIAQEVRIPPLDLDKLENDPSVLEIVPQDLAVQNNMYPLTKIDNVLTIAVADPFDIVRLDDIRRITGAELRLVLSTETTIQTAIASGYSTDDKKMEELFENAIEPEMEFSEEEMNFENINLEDLTGDASPVVKLVNLIIYKGIRDRASDIHIEAAEKRVIVRYRLDGVLSRAFAPPKKMLNAIVSRLKILSSLDIAERMKPQDGKFQLRVEGRQIDFRVSILPTIHGEKVVMRILDAENLALSLDLLGFEQRSLEHFKESVRQPYGMILVTGPTGSGKSTTLYSAIKEILSPESNFVTVEDPVEYQLEGVNQTQVNAKRGITFAGALRSILRQDPDVILIGEIRDAETLDIAVKAALTGHLVLSTLHTNDASSTVTRMIDMGMDPFMVASSIVMIAAQRLARKLCDVCKEPLKDLPPRERLLQLGFAPEECENIQLYHPVGCTRCSNGYKGRFALLETMLMTDELKRLIIAGASAVDVKAKAIPEGMLTLRRAGLLNALRGRTSLEEVLRVTMAD
ncbi:MAG: type IV-A pilus assembly ATPase PilB [Gemmatimonadota bacterium]|nr:MAG: type IV-A pilus assembly ATPase PilB [Gemmatimonadota bacterium]